MRHLVLHLLLITLGLMAHATDLGFRYQNGKCVNADAAEGFNPGFIGQCGDFRAMTLTLSTLDDADLSGSTFAGANLQLVTFKNSFLVGVDFSRARLAGVDFYRAQIEMADFKETTLDNVKVGEAKFANVRFDLAKMSRLDLSYGDFMNCSFKSGDLSYANLFMANVSRSNFDGAIIKYADLTDAIVAGATFTGATYNRYTRLPFSSETAEHWQMILKNRLEFSGVRTQIPLEELDGWKVCHTSQFAEQFVPLADVMKKCNAKFVMLACKQSREKTLTVAAYGRYGMVFKDIGRSNEGTLENDVKFYFDGYTSMGFAAAGSKLDRNSCDVSQDDTGNRLCIHTSRNVYMGGGWRCGEALDPNGYKGYYHVFLTADE
jgi:uncharacterized protein YjbI with pentapeptide repeats